MGLAALGLIEPGAALACSVQRDYRVPTNLELAAEANTIVYGQVIGAATGIGDVEGALEIRPLGAVKGLVPGEALVLQGMRLRQPDDRGPATPDEPFDFAAPHPEALTGACIRRVFPAGATVLFFLERADGGWRPAGGPFSRWAEDVEGPQSPWSQLATLYARAAQVPPAERQAMLQDQLEALQARADDEIALAMAADIERSMATPGFPNLPEARQPVPQPLAKPEPVPPSDDVAAPETDAAPEGEADDPLGDLGARIDALRDKQAD
jgi:hypothetical protein